MATANKEKSPVDDLRDLQKSVDTILTPVNKVIDSYEKVRDQLDSSSVEKIDPLVSTLKRDRESHLRKAERILKPLKKIRSVKTPEQHMRVLDAGNQMFKLLDRIETATIPMTLDVTVELDKGIENATASKR